MPDVKFSNQYPYTDFHELNLDWVISQVKYWTDQFGSIKSIQSIELTSSVGLVDTYTITFTDGTSTTFEVHNGAEALDPTLSLADYAAEAKATGDAIAPLTAATNGKKVRIIAAAIRNSGNGWELISDSEHTPIGISSVSVDANSRIVINYDFTAVHVLSLVVCPDETFAGQYSAGASVGLDKSIITVYTQPQTIGGYVVYNGSWNVDNSDFLSASFSSGKLRIYHAESFANYPLSKNFDVSANGRECNVRLGSVGNDYFEVQFLASDGTVKTTPDTDMKVYAMRQRPAFKVNAENIVSASGNFWIYGIMEVS